MEALLAALITAGVISLGVRIARKRRAAKESSQRQLVERSIYQMLPGDIVTIEGRDHTIEGVVELTQGASYWREAELRDGNCQRWLSVRPERDGGIIIADTQAKLRIFGEPSEQYDDAGDIFALDSNGVAKLTTRHGSLRALEGDSWRFWDYQRAGNQRLLLRQLGQTWQSHRGNKVPPHMIELWPAEPKDD